LKSIGLDDFPGKMDGGHRGGDRKFGFGVNLKRFSLARFSDEETFQDSLVGRDHRQLYFFHQPFGGGVVSVRHRDPTVL
jgi:hypothetical protein